MFPTAAPPRPRLDWVFEKRVVGQYAIHRSTPGIPLAVKQTLSRIMDDERWHIQWVREALTRMAFDYGADNIKATLKRFSDADREVYRKTTLEHSERIGQLRLSAT